MSMFNDIVWDAKGTHELSENNSKTMKEYAERFPRGHWTFPGPGSEIAIRTDLGIGLLRRFCCNQCLGERTLKKSTGGGRTTIHFTASDDNVQLILKMVISVNQLSLYGVAPDLIEELPHGQRAPGKICCIRSDGTEILTQHPLAEVQADDERQGNPSQDHERRFEKLPEDQNSSKLCSEAGLIWSKLDNYSMLFRHRMERRIFLYAEYTRYLERKTELWIESDARFGPRLGHKSLQETREIRR